MPSSFCRDLFYKDVPLFKKQSVVDKVRHFNFHPDSREEHRSYKLIDDLAATIDTRRAHLNIVNKSGFLFAFKFIYISHSKRASPKGLICGAGLSIHTVSGNVIHITESEVRISLLPPRRTSYNRCHRHG